MSDFTPRPDPTPEEIRRRAAEIRARWDVAEEISRRTGLTALDREKARGVKIVRVRPVGPGRPQ